MPLTGEAKREYARHWRAENKDRQSAYEATRRRKFREMLDAAKARPCADCGVQYPPWVMDFDHAGRQKVGNISMALQLGWAWAVIQAEIEKCEVVCANCHRQRTHGRGSVTN